MNRFARLMGLMVAGIFIGGCETPQFQTMSILDTPNRVVALRHSDRMEGRVMIIQSR